MHLTQPFARSLFFLAALIAVAITSTSADDPKSSPVKEKELLAILSSDAPGGEKAIACKNLAIHGSSEAVPELAKLLPNAELSSWARIALEVIPGDEADEALRTASKSLEGRLLVGTINSIGVRRDAGAVDSLIARLPDADVEVASAAAVALGRIGNDAATKALRAALTVAPVDVRSAVAEGCVLCAERLHSEGQSAAAAEIYDEIRKADVPMQRKIEATRGAILARNQQGLPLLIETLQSPDKKLFQLALGTAHEFQGNEVDKALAIEMARSTPQRGALIIQAMADRPKTVDLAAVLTAAGQGDKQMRMSAINALRHIGDDSCLTSLLKIAGEGDAELAQSAKETLGDLPGTKVDAQIVSMLRNADGESYKLLLQLTGQRRINAVPDVRKALNHSDPSVRSAAFIALGEIVSIKDLSLLISQVVAPAHPQDAVVAQQALQAASIRMPDREACANELTMALKKTPQARKNTLLEILGEVGGTTALQTLGDAAKSTDPELQDTGSRLLGKWNSVDVAPVLLELAKSAPAEKFQVRALRGYIGLARKFAMTDQQRAEMCQQALAIARRPDDQKLVLDVLKLHPSIETLKLAINAKQIPELKDDASAATQEIARQLSTAGVDVSALVSGENFDKVKLEIVKAEYGGGTTQKDVTEVVRKHASNLSLITLASANYNASFGGDPLPGSVKQLTIQYRINGKSGEASFPENAVIILPIPK